MPVLVGPLPARAVERDELVAEVDERHPLVSAPEAQRPEEPLPEGDRLAEVTHLQRDVVDSDRSRHIASVATAMMSVEIPRPGENRSGRPTEERVRGTR